MQIRAARQHRQGLVRRIAAHVRAERHRMGVGGQEAQIRAVRVVDQQRHAVAAADRRKPGDVHHMAEVVGACDIDGGGTARQGGQTRVQRVRRDAAGQAAVRRLRAQPFDVKIEQRRRAQKRAVRVPARQNKRPRATAAVGQQRQIQHRADGERGAFAGVQRPAAAEQPRRDALALRDHAPRVVQHVRARHLGDVQRLGAEDGDALVAGHVQAQRVGGGVGADKIADRRFHLIPHPALWPLRA